MSQRRPDGSNASRGKGVLSPAASHEQASGVRLSLDEFEAIRLADLEELKQVDAARSMRVSRPTFSRSSHRREKKWQMAW